MANQSKNFPDNFYRVTIKALYVLDGKVLLYKESSKLSGDWELPGGGMDFSEIPHGALRREMSDESGLIISKISKNPVYVWSWRYENCRDIDWYYSLVLAYRVELENLNFTKSDECEEVRFFSKEELETVKLHAQTNNLKKYFNPDDFKSPLL